MRRSRGRRALAALAVVPVALTACTFPRGTEPAPTESSESSAASVRSPTDSDLRALEGQIT